MTLLKKILDFLGLVLRLIFRPRISPVVGFSHSLILKEANGMEKFLFTWQPSPSSFVEKHNLITKISGGAEVVGPDLPASSISLEQSFPTGASVEAWIRTTGDNGTTADSNHVSFTAANAELVQPVSSLHASWVSHQE